MIDENGWVYCPVCKGKTRLKIAKDTKIKRLPLYCQRCKQTTTINIKNMELT